MAMSETDNVPEAWIVRWFMNLERDPCVEGGSRLPRPYSAGMLAVPI
jgi:hypothetical protein